MLDEITKCRTYPTVMTLEEQVILLTEDISTRLRARLLRVTTIGTTKIPSVIILLLEQRKLTADKI